MYGIPLDQLTDTDLAEMTYENYKQEDCGGEDDPDWDAMDMMKEAEGSLAAAYDRMKDAFEDCSPEFARQYEDVFGMIEDAMKEFERKNKAVEHGWAFE